MIKNILFDFGDVFINLDKEATIRMLKNAGYTDISPQIIPIIRNYEKGNISTDEFINSALEFFPGLSQEELKRAWNGIILDFPEYRLDFIEGLAKNKKHRLFLFSNTNTLHIAKVKERMGLTQYENFRSCFEGFYLSHEVRCRKPDPEVFEMVLAKHNLLPAETLFVDDTFEHIESAGRLGLRTWHLQVGEEDIVDLIKLL